MSCTLRRISLFMIWTCVLTVINGCYVLELSIERWHSVRARQCVNGCFLLYERQQSASSANIASNLISHKLLLHQIYSTLLVQNMELLRFWLWMPMKRGEALIDLSSYRSKRCFFVWWVVRGCFLRVGGFVSDLADLSKKIRVFNLENEENG